MRHNFIARSDVHTIAFAYSVQPILISRFLINLRQTQSPNNATEMTRESKFMPNFRVPTLVSFQGNMGEPLEFGAHDDEGNIEEEIMEEARDEEMVVADDGTGDETRNGITEEPR